MQTYKSEHRKENIDKIEPVFKKIIESNLDAETIRKAKEQLPKLSTR